MHIPSIEVGISVTRSPCYVLPIRATSETHFIIFYTRTWFNIIICSIHTHKEPEYKVDLKKSDDVKHMR